MNKTVIIIIAAVLIIGGYFVFANRSADSTIPAVQNLDTNNNGSVSGAKIDINAVCEGALAYMTFPSGEEAEKFVQECKEGKRPEVIEKFKADMNLGDGAAI